MRKCTSGRCTQVVVRLVAHAWPMHGQLSTGNESYMCECKRFPVLLQLVDTGDVAPALGCQAHIKSRWTAGKHLRLRKHAAAWHCLFITSAMTERLDGTAANLLLLMPLMLQCAVRYAYALEALLNRQWHRPTTTPAGAPSQVSMRLQHGLSYCLHGIAACRSNMLRSDTWLRRCTCAATTAAAVAGGCPIQAQAALHQARHSAHWRCPSTQRA